MDDNTFLPKLSQNLLEILEDNEYYDTTIEVGNDPYVKIFHAHMVILYYRSPYLRRILSTNRKKNDGILTHIKLPNISPEVFQIILRYIYGGRLSLKEYDTLDIIKILVAANELSLQELITHLQSFLIINKENWINQNFNLIYQTSFNNDTFLKLQNFCIELISKEPEKIFNSIDFNSISEKCLITLIKQDDIQLDDIQIWEHVLKWGIAQNPELPSNSSNYSKDDFNTLKITLKQCIPFIKFYNLSSEEFLNNVYPYKKIIPKELREDLLKYFLNPKNQSIKKLNNSKSIDSKIITLQHAELISKWIDRLEITDEIKNSYEFKLILRGSRDGFSSSKFHEICDNQFHTISIIKVKDSDEILGGYNPTIWDSFFGYYSATEDIEDCFIFSFKSNDSTDIANNILSRVTVKKYAIYNDSNFGPSFNGLILFGSNYYDESYCRNSSCYEKPIRETEEEFSVEEYEVFQIMKTGKTDAKKELKMRKELKGLK
ncbi:uncharacterized protein OCT59_002460 [Rhizophagus irregularis]|uniref:Kelch-like protein 17 n=2 Tax=Rhizophagus irregularis TaxID=588596 RepID=A0A015JX11_RHIIW|nr:hypothetical protein RirG_260040 [Rhizophagus irregularis DAOM 197198w]UZO10882.1 hypothetical protein OCT59_002460 [Rhizophagus irregularis]